MANTGGVYTWSKTAGSNAGADNTVNWAEGQAPSSLNDSARATMASVAKWRDDISGSIVTTGTSVAYQVASNQSFDLLANFKTQLIAFTPHVTNGAGPVTMTVDGFANLPLRSAPGVELPAGVLIQGTPYVAMCGTDGVLYLHGYYGASAVLVPLAASVDYWGASAPNSSFALMYGQAISRSTYSGLFGLIGTTFGAGDGSTTFNLPDARGRVIAGADAMGGSSANRLTGYGGMSGTALGSVGGGQTMQLATGHLPPYTPSGSIAASLTSLQMHVRTVSTAGTNILNHVSAGTNAGTDVGQQSIDLPGGNVSATFTGSPQGGTSTAFSLIQPTIVANKVIRVL